MWSGTAIFGNRTRLGRGKREISIKSYEKFFVLPGVIDRAAAFSEKERAEAPAKSLSQSSNFPGRPNYRVLNDLSRLIDTVYHIPADSVEPRELDMQSLAGARNHGFDSPELVPGCDR